MGIWSPGEVGDIWLEAADGVELEMEMIYCVDKAEFVCMGGYIRQVAPPVIKKMRI